MRSSYWCMICLLMNQCEKETELQNSFPVAVPHVEAELASNVIKLEIKYFCRINKKRKKCSKFSPTDENPLPNSQILNCFNNLLIPESLAYVHLHSRAGILITVSPNSGSDAAMETKALFETLSDAVHLRYRWIDIRNAL
ncbi:hypothetical protein ILYODFUR_034029 [Ilyodon furcidens]|uniref:Uncharacterized protein n=1 Tax=Ilyodon furcidens TaxID=33524 RepID=A0ABV0SUH7_9TELE